MDNLKLVSVRIDPRDVETLDEYANYTPYRSRCGYIRAAVSLMAALCRMGRHEEVMSFYHEHGAEIDTFELSYHRAHD